MPSTKKTDNHSLAGKLDLRRHFLRAHHGTAPPGVIDCCQGSGKLWEQLRREFVVASYWGMDLKPRKGRLKIDSARVLALPGWKADVIDVDAYGSPWNHWLALLPRVRSPLTVFLTVGLVRTGGGGGTSNAEKAACGLNFRRLSCPPSLLTTNAVRSHVLARMLALPLQHGLRVVECLEAPPGSSVRYFGLHLEPAQTAQTLQKARPEKAE